MCTTFGRPGYLTRALRAGACGFVVKAKNAQTLLLFSTSRLFRKQYKTLEFVERAHKSWDMRCIFIKSGVDTDDKKRWESILYTQSMIDQFVVTMYVDNIRSAHQGLLEKRLVFGTLSFGYKGAAIEGELTNRGKPRCRIVVDDKTAPIVRQIFKWYAEDLLPITDIIRRLNDDPDVPLPPRCVNDEWTRLSVKGILENTRYRGLWRYGVTEAIYQPDGDYIRQKSRVEPLKEVTIADLRIVSDEIWYAAQDRLQSDQGNRGRKAK
jgi:site-specific DNA recombinase